MIGRTLSHFTITAKLGEGGMGEVYEAEDSKLGRRVAIKVLPATVAEAPERLARFDREARVLASLNHPAIASIYSVEHDASTHFLVMELVEGEDLSERIARGPMPLAEGLSIGLSLCEALESAHESGIVHRDLKPANIRIGSGGEVKILDFGLAKAFRSGKEPAGDSHQYADSPTLTAHTTQAGMLLGTAAYMSPEQARGQEADKRSDIWSFGVVLYEMLTGKALFGGNSTVEVLTAVLAADLDLEALPAGLPSPVRRLLERCLDRNPKERLRDIGEARIRLQRSLTGSGEEDQASLRVAELKPWRRALPWMAAALALTAVLLAVRPYLPWLSGERPARAGNPLAAARFTRITDFEGAEFDAAISPDGRFVTFVSDRGGEFEILIGQIGTGEFRRLVSAEEFASNDARAPVNSLGFNAQGTEVWLYGGPWLRVRAVPVLGGQIRNFLGEQVVSAAPSPDGGRIVYHERVAGDPVYVADANGASSRKILGPPAGVHQHFPIWSVDGEWIYLVRGRPSTLEMNLWRVRPDGQGLEQLTHRQLDVQFPTPIDKRTVLYSARDSDGAGPWLWTVDVESKVSQRASVGLEQYTSLSASADGQRLAATMQDSRAGLWSVPILDRLATEADVTPFADLSTKRALSPRFGAGSLFYLSSKGIGDGLWRYENGAVEEIWRGSESALLEPVAVSPDGERLVLLLRRADRWRLHLLRADGTGLELLSDRIDARGAAAWSPDGEWVVTGGFMEGIRGLYKVPVGGGEPVRLAEGEAMNPVWSPQGNLIVYTGAQVNVLSSLVAVRPDGAQVELPEIELFRFGQRVRFLPDGSGLVYMRGLGFAQDFWLLDLATMESRRLTRLEPASMMRAFDITPDGRFIVFDRLRDDSDIVLIELAPRE